MDLRTPREAGRSTRLPGTSACPSPPLSRVTGSSLVLSQASRLLGLLGAVTSSQTFRVRGARDSFERSNVAESPRVAVRLVFSSWLDGGSGSWEEDPRAQGLFHPVVPRVMCHRDLSLSMLTVAPGQVALVGLLCRHRAFEVSFGRTHTRSLPRVPTQGHHVHPPPFSFEEVEAQRRPSAPRGLDVRTGTRRRWPAALRPRLGPRRPSPPAAACPASWLPGQTRRPGQLPRVGPAPDVWACRAAGKLIREATVALDGGKSQQPRHLHQHGPCVTRLAHTPRAHASLPVPPEASLTPSLGPQDVWSGPWSLVTGTKGQVFPFK